MQEDQYPKVVYGYAILLDNKLENWKVTCHNRHSVYEFTGYWKRDRLKYYKLEKICWICKNVNELNKAFDIMAPRFFRTWKHSDDYMLIRAY